LLLRCVHFSSPAVLKSAANTNASVDVLCRVLLLFIPVAVLLHASIRPLLQLL
jgi:hypothetical protein